MDRTWSSPCGNCGKSGHRPSGRDSAWLKYQGMRDVLFVSSFSVSRNAHVPENQREKDHNHRCWETDQPKKVNQKLSKVNQKGNRKDVKHS
jgi:hypothetical protein